uniref:Chromo domain-containing protein n=1 Tax=Parascaris univalens TaxID=6257 RepID=A0A915BRV6_PARUN
MSEGDKETGYYDVERIVGYRKSERMMRDEYLVKWEGCEEYTFEPVHHLNGCRRKMSEFHERILEAAGLESNPAVKTSNNLDSESDVILPPEAKEKINMLKRLYPVNAECGIAKGWKVSKILGAQLRSKPYTYLVQYEDHKQVEHVDVEYVNKKCPQDDHVENRIEKKLALAPGSDPIVLVEDISVKTSYASDIIPVALSSA